MAIFNKSQFQQAKQSPLPWDDEEQNQAKQIARQFAVKQANPIKQPVTDDEGVSPVTPGTNQGLIQKRNSGQLNSPQTLPPQKLLPQQQLVTSINNQQIVPGALANGKYKDAMQINPAVQRAIQAAQQPVVSPVDVGTVASDNEVDNTPLTEDELAKKAIREMLEGKMPERDKARQAMQDDLRVKSAEAVQSARGRAGLAGMGLTGAAGALETSVRRGNARTEVQALEDFDKNTRDEILKRIGMGIEGRSKERTGQDADSRRDLAERSFEFEKELAGKKEGRESKAFDAAIELAEKEVGKDLNGDGTIAGRKPEEVKAEETKAKEQETRGWSDDEQESMRIFSNRPLQGDEKDALAKSKAEGNPNVWYTFMKRKAAEKGMTINQYIDWRKNNPIDWVIDQTGQANKGTGW